MSSKTAFPTTVHNYGDGMYSSEGMTLRDYFAANALQIGNAANQPPAYDNETRARQAYDLADAMLKAREQ